MGAQLLKEAATKTNDVAGDGTTTATVLAQAIVNEGLRNVAAGANPMLLRRASRRPSARSPRISAKSGHAGRGQEGNRADRHGLRRRPEIGNLIAEVMEKSARTASSRSRRAEGITFETEYVEGMQFDRGYICAYFVTNPTAWRP